VKKKKEKKEKKRISAEEGMLINTSLVNSDACG
jgi:hypothetical protein